MSNVKKEYDVFLSYSQQDRPWVSDFVSALQNLGIRAWSDINVTVPGKRWQEELQTALRKSTTIVMVLSPNSISSPQTFFELGAAIADSKRIIPVLIGDAPPRDMPPLLSQFQILRASSPSEAGKRVAEVIEKAALQDTSM